MKRVALVVSLLFLSSMAFAQHCEDLIWDEASIFHSMDRLNDAAKLLINEGADVKIVSIARLGVYGTTLQAAENALELRCTAWRSPAGARKANLVVFMVAPNDRKKNIFFGGAYKGPFPNEDAVNVLYSRAANPFFASKQWDEGMAATIRDFAAKVTAYHDQQQHPAVTQVTQQATDLHGLWTFLTWLLLGTFVFIVALAAWKILTRRREEEEKRTEAQVDALRQLQLATNAFAGMLTSHPRYNELSQRYSAMSKSLKLDPNEDMSVAEYKQAGVAWKELRTDIAGERRPVAQAKPDGAQAQAEKQKVNQPEPWKDVRPKEVHHHHRETIVVNNQSSNDGLLTGVLIGEGLGAQRREPEPAPSRFEEPPSRSSDSDSSSSGSDSSWGFGSSSDSGSDSSFGGGSDSGGGSGSDSSW